MSEPGLETRPCATPEPAPEARFSAIHGFGLLALYVAAQVLIGVLVGAGFGVWFVANGGDAEDSAALTQLVTGFQGLIGVFAALIGGVAFVAFVLRWKRGPRGVAFRRGIGLAPTSRAAVLAGAAAGVAAAALYLVVASAAGVPPPSTPGPATELAASPGLKQQVWTIFGLLGSPPLEEFVFRGVLLTAFASSWGLAWATLLTTSLFVGMHVGEFGTYWPAALGLTVMSLTATYLRIRTGSLWPAVAVHLGYNLVLVSLVHLMFALGSF